MMNTRPGPLEGIRALVLTQAWSGTYCTYLLALAGVEVVQIEARRRLDPWRGGYEAPIPAGLADIATAQHGWNCNGRYNAVSSSKRGITLDLGTPEGKEIFKRLVPEFDIVAENFSPRVMDNLGLGYSELSRLRDDVIMCSISAYGASGRYKDYIGNGGTMEPSSGMSSLFGYQDGPPLNSGNMYPDPVAGVTAFAAILTALFHRIRTGAGQHIDVSMQEANLSFVGDAALEFLKTSQVRPRMGNRHQAFAPHGIYPAAGEDQWIAIAAESEVEWQALAHAAGHPEWLEKPEFFGVAKRKQHEDQLDSALGRWTAGQPRDELVTLLQSVGVIAAPVLTTTDIAVDAELARREFVVDITHPEAGTHRQTAAPFRFSRAYAGHRGPAPTLGQHSAQVLEEYLGVTRAEYEALVIAGVTGDGPPA